MMRPGNALMAAIGTLAGMVLARGGPLAPITWAAAPAAAFLLSAWGNVRNDLHDIEIDRTAHPGRPLPSGRMRPAQAQAFASLLLLLALAAAYLAARWPTLLFAAANALLLALYESRLKSRGLAGNLAIAFLVATTFLFGAAATGTDVRTWGLVCLLAAMALLVNAARELLKDLEDMPADRGHRTTFPLRSGARATVRLALSLVVAAVAISFLAPAASPALWWRPWLGLLAASDGLFLVAAARAARAPGPSQRLLKLAMAGALAAFLAGPLVPLLP
jgi:geranylgeranylglycerol-phosphate geranylgeranyltransferase